MSYETKNLNKERQDMSKQPAKKTAAKKTATKKAAPKKKAAPAKKADPVKRAYNKVEKVAKENGIDFDTYEEKAIEAIEEASEKVVTVFVQNRKGLLSKLFSWIKK